MADKALVKQITFGVFDDGMRFVAEAEYARTGIVVPLGVSTELLPLDANPSQISQAIVDAVVANGAAIGFNVTASDVYVLDLVRGV
jgi:hypothetical protein